MMHPSVHAFWTKNIEKASLRKVLDRWFTDPTGQFYTKQPMKVDDVNLQFYCKMMTEKKESGPAEGGFVDCIFEFWKVRTKIVRARREILSTGQFTDCPHRFGDFTYQKQCSFNSSYISGLVSEQSVSLTKEIKEKAAKVCYDFLSLQHQSSRLQLEKKHLAMINA